MKKYTVVAYGDEDGYPRQSTTIEAANQEEAQSKAWRLFPEHHEVGVFEESDSKWRCKSDGRAMGRFR